MSNEYTQNNIWTDCVPQNSPTQLNLNLASFVFHQLFKVENPPPEPFPYNT